MTGPDAWTGVHVYTIGHSTRSLDELIAALRSFEVTTVVDIRTIPRSRRNPQFEGAALAAALDARGMAYVHVPLLGGLRHARKDSPNAAWRNDSFRGFADYMQTEAFEAGLSQLRALAEGRRVALLCAEAMPWRCHRSLVGDALTARGAHVEHILGVSRATPHRTTAFAEIRGTQVTYPGERLVTPAPFHLEATVRVLQRRPTNPVDLWEDERYRRALPTPDGLALVEVENRGTIDEPDVRWSVRQGPRVDLTGVLRRVLGLDVAPAPLQGLVEAEPALRPARALRGMRPPRFTSLFETCLNVVPFQQVSLDAGLAVVGRLVDRFGEHLDHEGRRFHAFPTAASVARAEVDEVRACGLSARKAESLVGLARTIEAGDLTEEGLAGASTREALETLDALPGIGPWSASLVLLRGLGRLDVFPPGDVGVARGLDRLLGLPEEQIVCLIERFGEARGYLYFCSLGGGLLEKGLIHPAPPR